MQSEHQRLRSERYGCRAAFFALWLRQQGYRPDEAAALVAERYPRLREQLRGVMAEGNRPEEKDRKETNA